LTQNTAVYAQNIYATFSIRVDSLQKLGPLKHRCNGETKKSFIAECSSAVSNFYDKTLTHRMYKQIIAKNN